MAFNKRYIMPIKKNFTRLFLKRAIHIPSLAYDTNTNNSYQSHLGHYEIVLYFSAAVNDIYQVEQWLKPLYLLNTQKKIIFIVRKRSTYLWLKTHTDFPVIFCHSINDLTKTYEENNFKCILYVNHGLQNFQSLMNRNALHVHINHGESEKTSTISNQVNAYSYILIVGNAAYDKYNLNIVKKDMSKFIKIGRPQLDNIDNISSFNTNKKIILYAPTWEGTHDSMNYTSLNEYGLNIVEKLLEDPNYYLIYKPHPNTGARDSKTRKVNHTIIKKLKQHSNSKAILSGDINSIYPHIDLAIFDNSAVAIDYLHIDKPMIMTNMFYKIKDRQSSPMIINAAKMIELADVQNIINIISFEIAYDTLKEERRKMKDYFLGEFNYGKQARHTI